MIYLQGRTPERKRAAKVPNYSRAERVLTGSVCSLVIAAPCLLYAHSVFSSGHAAPGRLALFVAAVLVVLYLYVMLLLFKDEFIEMAIPFVIVSILFVILCPVFLQARTKAQAATCLSHAKQVAWGMRFYAEDYDGVLPNNAASFKTLTSPYVKDGKSFTCPLDPPGVNSYTFNSNLAGVSTNTVTVPDNTVLIYEGKAGRLNYRHAGRASVMFVDGHGKLISPDQATALLWTVPVPQKR
ncbi:MAG: hypothetical protein JWL77_1930 [Chthonomonadaceae bacterium]|nr:hypothetical protein [Chthonomonadaceae bacterium]